MKKGIHLVVGAFLLPLGTPFCRGITFSSRAWCLKMFMKPYAESFYRSKQWQDTRNAYASSVGGLCEMCKANGLYNAGEIVHHIVHITPQNINDPNVTLDWNNLMLVCRDCHAKIHTETPKRYVVDAWGRVVATDK